MAATDSDPIANIARVKRSKSEARRAYNRLSRFYDLLAGSSERPAREAGLELLRVQPGEHVLEIGCGTGQALVTLAQAAGEEGRVVGIDISERMLARAAQRLAKAGLSGRVTLQQGDAAEIDLGQAAYNAVFMSFVLELFDTPDIPRVLANCRRAMKPGGRICVAVLAKSAQPGFAERLYGWAHERFPAYADCRPIYPRPALQAAGFKVPVVRGMRMWGLPVEVVMALKMD
jgi:demethylmenaquinone methyltransferase/2-methoxy-6-polyprenyl-1,4-benzoquinol methylase